LNFVILLVAGVLLWKRQRRGLVVLTGTLIAELVCGIGPAIVNAVHGAQGISTSEHALLVGLALFPVFPQILTAFPLVAGILIFFAYRYLGIPARST
jgi:hypothetical protein